MSSSPAWHDRPLPVVHRLSPGWGLEHRDRVGRWYKGAREKEKMKNKTKLLFLLRMLLSGLHVLPLILTQIQALDALQRRMLRWVHSTVSRMKHRVTAALHIHSVSLCGHSGATAPHRHWPSQGQARSAHGQTPPGHLRGDA